MPNCVTIIRAMRVACFRSWIAPEIGFAEDELVRGPAAHRDDELGHAVRLAV